MAWNIQYCTVKYSSNVLDFYFQMFLNFEKTPSKSSIQRNVPMPIDSNTGRIKHYQKSTQYFGTLWDNTGHFPERNAIHMKPSTDSTTAHKRHNPKWSNAETSNLLMFGFEIGCTQETTAIPTKTLEMIKWESEHFTKATRLRSQRSGGHTGNFRRLWGMSWHVWFWYWTVKLQKWQYDSIDSIPRLLGH